MMFDPKTLLDLRGFQSFPNFQEPIYPLDFDVPQNLGDFFSPVNPADLIAKGSPEAAPIDLARLYNKWADYSPLHKITEEVVIDCAEKK